MQPAKLFNTQTTDLDEVVFAQRHRTYGAYELRHDYPERIKRAYVITITCLIAPIVMFVLFNRYTLPLVHKQKNFGDPPSKPWFNPKFEQPHKNISHIKGTTTAHIWKLSKDSVIDKSQKKDDLSSLFTAGILNANKETGIQTEGGGSINRIISIKTSVPTGSGINEAVTARPDLMPVFPGGDNALVAYFSNHIRYTQLDIERNIEGTIYVEFIVMPDGAVADVKALSDIGGTMRDQALTAVKNMPHWQPGKNGTVIVPVRMTLPVKCALHY